MQDKYLKQANDLISKMTVEEKVAQMLQISQNCVTEEQWERFTKLGVGSYLHVNVLGGSTSDELRALADKTRLKIPPILGIDAIHGHSLQKGATIYPSQLAMACSWDKDMIKQMGVYTARETYAGGQDWTFSPVLCLARDLRWGRVDETFGEDPYLAGELGYAIIKGYQAENYIIACAKHYIAYGEATGGRDAYDSSITYRKLKDVFLYPFKRAVDAGVGSVMTAYGSIDYKPFTIDNKSMKDILRDEIGFDGFVVTDWCNFRSLYDKQFVCRDIYEAAKLGIEAGNDMSMNSVEFFDATVKLVKDGMLEEKYLDDAVRRILAIKYKLGLFDKNKKRLPKSIIGCKEHEDFNLSLAKESLVMLKNNGVLPIKQGTKIALVGDYADNIFMQLGDWTYTGLSIYKEHVNRELLSVDADFIPNKHYTVKTAMQELYGDDVAFARGCYITKRDDELLCEAKRVIASNDVVVLCVGDQYVGEGHDVSSIELSDSQRELSKYAHESGKPVVTVIISSKPISASYFRDNSDAVIVAFNNGMQGGMAVAEAIKGTYNPSGKLPITFPYSAAQTPTHYNRYSGWHGAGKYADLPDNEPVFAFGEGIGYSKITYGEVKLSSDVLHEGDNLKVCVDITNEGDMDAKEIVQVYVRDKIATILRPIMELKGFKKVSLKAGETKRVEIVLPYEAFGYYLTEDNFVVEKGEFDIMVGTSSREYQTKTLEIK